MQIKFCLLKVEWVGMRQTLNFFLQEAGKA